MLLSRKILGTYQINDPEEVYRFAVFYYVCASFFVVKNEKLLLKCIYIKRKIDTKLVKKISETKQIKEIKLWQYFEYELWISKVKKLLLTVTFLRFKTPFQKIKHVNGQFLICILVSSVKSDSKSARTIIG